MAKFIASIKAIITRLVFAAHAFVAIWQVTKFKQSPFYWYLSCPIVFLFFEGIFTLTIKENQEWKWFCPSVFLYLGSVVPAIWLLELDKVDRRMKNFGSSVTFNDTFDLTNVEDLKLLQKTLGTNIRLPDIQMSTEMWVTLIEQFLMLILIIGRWMLPKGELTRDQLSQLLLVYIGTAADIIEFFDSFKEDRVAREPILVYLTLGIWAWSLMQFTVVLTATKSRKSRLSSAAAPRGSSRHAHSQGCCTIDVWAIAINMFLQDGPFLAFRLILIIHFEIVSYMNIFFTCKNTLVILLQLYRLYVVQSESSERRRKIKLRHRNCHQRYENGTISIISRPETYGGKRRLKRRRLSEDDEDEDYREDERRRRRAEGRRSRDVEANFESDRTESEESDSYEPSPRKKRNRKARHEVANSTSSSKTSSKGQHKRSREGHRRHSINSENGNEDKEFEQKSNKKSSSKTRQENSTAKRKSGEVKEKKKRTDEEASGDKSKTSGQTSEDSESESEDKKRYERRKRRSERD